MKKILTLLFFVSLIISCNQKQTENFDYSVAETGEEMMTLRKPSMNLQSLAVAPEAEPDIQETTAKKIIKNGFMEIRVAGLEETKLRIDSLIKLHNGYYAGERLNNTDRESSYSLKIRIPSDNYEVFISNIEASPGEILNKNIDARDVTDQFIDLETRLENKQSYLERYRELLKQAKNVREILDIEEKIRVLEEEIESTTGRLRYLSNQVDYSTLDLTLSKKKDFKYNPVSRANFSEKLKQSLSKGWFALVDFFLFIINVWPFWIIAAAVVFIWRKAKRNRKNKRE